MSDPRVPHDPGYRGPNDQPSGRLSSEPVAGWISDGKEVLSVGKDVFAILRGSGGQIEGETLEISMLSAERVAARPSSGGQAADQFWLHIKLRNASPHTVYVEEVSVVADEARDRPDAKDAVYSVRVKDDPWTGPVRLPYDANTYLHIYIDLAPGTWPAEHSYGVVSLLVTKLNEVARQERRVTFPIRR